MEMLDLSALEFTRETHREVGPEFRKWLISCLEFNTLSIRSIAIEVGINYLPLLRFKDGKTSYMSFSNMCKLRDYIKGLMKPDDELEKDSYVERLKDEHFFEG